MRPKFVLTLMVITGLILMATFKLHRKPGTIQRPVPAEVVAPAPVKPEPVPQPPAMLAALPVITPSPELKQAIIDDKIQQLTVWSLSDDSASVEYILNEIATNSEKKVRMAAIKAAKQTGNREIIPALKDVAGRVDDLEEKRALLDAADFLAGPTVSEQMTNPVPQQVAVLTP